MTIRILVTGSREWTDRETVARELTRACDHFHAKRTVIVIGDCPTGADRIAQEWVESQASHAVKHEVHVAHWNEQGKAAGPIRNQRMVDLGADLFLAFPTEKSVGTWDCIKRANRAGITVRIIPSRTK